MHHNQYFPIEKCGFQLYKCHYLIRYSTSLYGRNPILSCYHGYFLVILKNDRHIIIWPFVMITISWITTTRKFIDFEVNCSTKYFWNLLSFFQASIWDSQTWIFLSIVISFSYTLMFKWLYFLLHCNLIIYHI